MTCSLRGSRRKARAVFLRWLLGSILLAGSCAGAMRANNCLDGDLIAGMVSLGLVTLGWSICGAFKAASVRRSALEIDSREVRRPISPWKKCSPWVAVPRAEILLAYSRPKSTREGEVVLVTSRGRFVIPDHFDVSPSDIARHFSPRPDVAPSDRSPELPETGSPELDRLIVEQLSLHPPGKTLVHSEPPRLLRRGRWMGCAFLALGLLFVLMGLVADRHMLASSALWFAGSALTFLFVPAFPKHSFVVATPEWLILGAREESFLNGLSHEVVPSSWVREVGHDHLSKDLCVALKSGTTIRGGPAALEPRLREVLSLSSSIGDPEIYLQEAAAILGLPPLQAGAAIAAAGLDQDPSTVGFPRWRRSEIERLRGRLLEAPPAI